MAIATICSSCSAKLQAPDAAAGRKVKCPKCGTPIAVPATNKAGAGPAPATSKAGTTPAPAKASKAGGAPAPAKASKAVAADAPPSKLKPAAPPPDKPKAPSGDASPWEQSQLLQHDEWTFKEQGWLRINVKNRHFHLYKAATKDIIGYADE